jgi:hypothetical protein
MIKALEKEGYKVTKEKSDTIIINNLEIERTLHTEMSRLSLIKIPDGWRLLTFDEFMNIWNNHRDKFDFGGDKFDEVVKQPLKGMETKYPYWNVWLARLGNDSYVNGRRSLGYDSTVRGVRFAREVKDEM